MNNSLNNQQSLKVPFLLEKENELYFPQLSASQYHSNIISSSPLIPPAPLKNRAKSMGNQVQLNSFDLRNFKEIWIRNKLSKMGLNLNVCTEILASIDYENQNLDNIITTITDKYFSEEMKINDDDRSYNFNEKDINSFKINIPRNWNFEDIKPVNKWKYCAICYENMKESEFLTIPNVNHHFCKSCIIHYLTQIINSNQILHIKCPDDCPYVLTDKDIEVLLESNQELLQKYYKFKKITQLSMNPNVRWCVRAGCENYIEGNSNQNRLVCDKCEQEICFLCRNEWHENRTCEQAMNQEFMKYKQRVEAKDCPSYHSPIEKIDGCNHMTCGKCRFQFCWLCLGKYGYKHFEWYNLFGCPGMQYARLDGKGKLRIFMERMLRIVCVILVIPLLAALTILALPLGLVFFSAFGPFLLYKDKYYPSCNGHDVFISILVILVSFILMPITMVLLICPGACILLYDRFR